LKDFFLLQLWLNYGSLFSFWFLLIKTFLNLWNQGFFFVLLHLCPRKKKNSCFCIFGSRKKKDFYLFLYSKCVSQIHKKVITIVKICFNIINRDLFWMLKSNCLLYKLPIITNQCKLPINYSGYHHFSSKVRNTANNIIIK
jgi:hypothetical protein